MSLLLALGLAIVLTGIVLHFIAGSAFSRRIDALRATLPEPVPAIPRTDLPIAIARFAEAATQASQPHDVVHLIQRGEMRLDENSAWQSFTANQSIAIAAVGFVWAARVRMGRLLSMRILDSFVRQGGLLEARLFGSIRLARASGPEADKGEVMRYLAELPWAPHAMLFNRELRWRVIEENLIEVSAATSAGVARVRFVFENDDIVYSEADDRPRDERGKMVPRPWVGRFRDYRQIGGLRIPARAEVGWVIDGELALVWRGEITDYQARPQEPN